MNHDAVSVQLCRNAGLPDADIDALLPRLGQAKGNDLAQTLTERGNRYGKFTGHAQITQQLKQTMYLHPGWGGLAADQKEALDMVAHKIGRVLNGDPDYADSWVDIAGYAKLVADRLEGVER